jgi:hypothetical protein
VALELDVDNVELSKVRQTAIGRVWQYFLSDFNLITSNNVKFEAGHGVYPHLSHSDSVKGLSFATNGILS